MTSKENLCFGYLVPRDGSFPSDLVSNLLGVVDPREQRVPLALPLDLSHTLEWPLHLLRGNALELTSSGPLNLDSLSSSWVVRVHPWSTTSRLFALSSRYMSTETKGKKIVSRELRGKTENKKWWKQKQNSWTYPVRPHNPSPRSEFYLDHQTKKQKNTDLFGLHSPVALSLKVDV